MVKKTQIICGFSLLSFSFSLPTTHAQLVVDNSAPYNSATHLVQKVLLGNGVLSSNITYTGAPVAIGYFNGLNTNLSLDSGIVLSTGRAVDAIGPNDVTWSSLFNSNLGMPGDVELEQITGNTANGSFDAASLEFDFVPSADTIRFDYVFASEEYPEFVGSMFNDAIAFIISGVSVAMSPTNIALIPGTILPVAIDNVNNGFANYTTSPCPPNLTTGPCMNCQYYIDNCAGAGGSEIQYDGFTTVLRAVSKVQCGETYHIKIVIADIGDHDLDAAVFLKAGSFSASGIGISVTTTSDSCGGSNGSATATVSGGTPPYTYNWNPSGQTTQTATGLAAGNYTVTVTDGGACSSTQTTQTVTVASSGSITAIAGQNSTICPGANVTFTASGGTTYLWSNGSTSSAINVSPTATSTYSVIVSMGTCADTASASVVVNPSPVAIITWSSLTITTGNSATLNASGGGTYTWSNGETGSSVTVTPLITTIYCVTIIDENNCTDSACLTINVGMNCSTADELYIPNAFSPNGDGENDVLKIYYGNELCVKTLELTIYNRWGQEVFKTTSISGTWDGKYEGKPVHTEVLVYSLNAILINGKEIIKKGNLSLVR